MGIGEWGRQGPEACCIDPPLPSLFSSTAPDVETGAASAAQQGTPLRSAAAEANIHQRQQGLSVRLACIRGLHRLYSSVVRVEFHRCAFWRVLSVAKPLNWRIELAQVDGPQVSRLTSCEARRSMRRRDVSGSHFAVGRQNMKVGGDSS